MAAITEAIVEALWKRHGRPRYPTRCAVIDHQCSIDLGGMDTITCSQYVATFLKISLYIYMTRSCKKLLLFNL